MWFLLCGVYGLSGVAMGAFAAHALKTRLDASALDIIQTATQYQLLHAVAMLALLGLAEAGRGQQIALVCFALAIPLFSGSLYLLALTGAKWAGPITPLGGLLFLAGWAAVVSLAWTRPA